MKQFKRKLMAVLLALFQIFTIISPIGTAYADNGGYIADFYAYVIFINSNEAALTKLANDNYYIIVKKTKDGIDAYDAKPFSDMIRFNNQYAQFHNGQEEADSYAWTVASFDNQPTNDQMSAAFSSPVSGNTQLADGINVNVSGTTFSANTPYNVITVNTYDKTGTTPTSPNTEPAAPIDGYYIRYRVQKKVPNSNPEVWEDVGWYIIPLDFDGDETHASVTVTEYKRDSDKQLVALDASDPDYRLKTDSTDPIRLVHFVGNAELSWINDYTDATDKTKVDDTAPEGHAFPQEAGSYAEDGSWQIQMNRAKPVTYYVRFKLDGAESINDLGKLKDLYVHVSLVHKEKNDQNQHIITDSWVKVDPGTMERPDQDGNIYIYVPVTKWYKDGVLDNNETFTGNELGTVLRLYGLPKDEDPLFSIDSSWGVQYGDDYVSNFRIITNGVRLNENEYINQFMIVSFDERIKTDSADGTKTEVIDPITLNKNTDKFPDCSLDYILQSYNVVTLCEHKTDEAHTHTTSLSGDDGVSSSYTWHDGDFYANNHTIGGILVRGDLLGVKEAVADSYVLTKPSAVGGTVPGATEGGKTVVHGRSLAQVDGVTQHFNFYVGDENIVFGQAVNGNTALLLSDNPYNRAGDIIVNEKYVDWQSLQGMMQTTSNAMRDEGINASELETYEYDGVTWLKVPVGIKVNWNFDENTQVGIDIIGDSAAAADAPATVVTNNGKGSYYTPRLAFNGTEQTETDEDGSGISMVYNFPRASKITLNKTPEFGHVIAPKADLVIPDGNYSGCMVANSVFANGEGHLYPYKGGTIIGFHGKIDATKLVNNNTPLERQKYTFILEKLESAIDDNEPDTAFWTRLNSVENNGSNILFDKVPFYEEGDYVFRIYEEQKEYPNTVIDNKQYIITVHVGKHTEDGGKKIVYDLDASTLKYYLVNSTNGLITITPDPDNDQKLAEINIANLTELTGDPSTISWTPGEDQNLIHPEDVTFFNTVSSNTGLSVTGHKTLEGKTLESGDFTFSLKGPGDSNDIVATGHNNGTGTITFLPKLDYELSVFDGQETYEPIYYTYRITEDIPEEATRNEDQLLEYEGVIYDETVRTIRVKVERDNNDQVVATIVADDSDPVEFTNKYKATGHADFSAYKELNGQPSGGFTFFLFDSDGNKIDEKTSDATTGIATFKTIPYTKSYEKDDNDAYIDQTGSYTYYIFEQVPEDAVNEDGITYAQATEEQKNNSYFRKDDVIYDGHIETVTVTVTDNGKGTLNVLYGGSETFSTPTFTNRAILRASIPVKKTYDKNPPADDNEARFVLLRYTLKGPSGTIRIVHNAEGDLTSLPAGVTYKAGNKTINSGDSLDVGTYTITAQHEEVAGYAHVTEPVTVTISENEETAATITTTYTKERGILHIAHQAGGELNDLPEGFSATYSYYPADGSPSDAESLNPGTNTVDPGTYIVVADVTPATPENYDYTGTTASQASYTVVVNQTTNVIFSSSYEHQKGSLELTHTNTLPYDGATLSTPFSYTLSDGTNSIPVNVGVNNGIPTGTYILSVTGGDIDGYNLNSPVVEPESIVIENNQATLVTVTTTYEITQNNPVSVTVYYDPGYGNPLQFLQSNSADYYIGDTVIVTFTHQGNNTTGYWYSTDTGNTSYQQGNGTITEHPEFLLSSDPYDIVIHDEWGDVKNYGGVTITKKSAEGKLTTPINTRITTSSLEADIDNRTSKDYSLRYGRRLMGYLASSDRVTGGTTSVIIKDQGGYIQDTSFAMLLTLTAPNALEGIFENLELEDEDGKPYYYFLYESYGPEGYTVSQAGAWIDAEDMAIGAARDSKLTNEVEFTNTKQVGNLTVTKTVYVDGQEATDATFTGKEFKVTIQNAAEEYLQSDKTFGTTRYEWTVKQNADLVISDIPTGRYTVTETSTGRNETKYTFDETNGTFSGVAVVSTTTSDCVPVDLVNRYTRDVAKLTVAKTATGLPVGSENKEYKFSVKIGDNYLQDTDGTLGTVVYWFTVGNGGKVEFPSLPVGTYTVTEDTDDAKITNYALVPGGSGDVVLTKDDDKTQTLTNDYTQILSAVQVTKDFSGIDELPEDFRITNSFNDTEFTVSNADSTEPYTWTIEDVPTGTEVTFTEHGIQVDGYTMTVNGTVTTTDTATATATSTEGSIDTAELVNDYTQKTGEKTVHDSVDIYKEDKSTKDPLDGAEFTLYSSETCKDADQIKTYTGKKISIDTEDRELATYLPADESITSKLYLKETKAPEGYVLDDTVHAITITMAISGPEYDADEDAFITTTTYSIEIDNEEKINIQNKKTEVRVQKTDVATGEELTGATIQILDKDGKIVAEWTSGKEAHEVTGLLTGVEYTLHEEVAPDGYTIAADTKFTIDETGKVNSSGTVTEEGVMLIEDAITSVKVSKVDVANGKELEGATIQILDKDGKVVVINGKKVEWVSGKAPEAIIGLKTGEEYTLHEEVAPDGYTIASDTKFTIDETGKVTSSGTVTEAGVMLIEDAMTSVKVSKVDVADGKELEGATIQILDKDGKVVAEWTSGKEAHEVTGLKTGEAYMLHEEVAPDGYTIAADTKFTIDETGKVTSTGTVTEAGVMLIEDAITSVKVSKVDVADGKELEGAHIQILDKDGKVITEWDSTEEAHEITGLKTGEEYTLCETVAPEGYTITTDTHFTIDKTGKVKSSDTTISEEGVLLVEDAMTSVKVSKVDVADGKELEGAHIQILDKDGKVITEWDSTEEAHEVTGLKTGEEYTLKETVAPDGYCITAETHFTIDKTGKVTSKDTKIREDGVMLVEDAMTSIKVQKTDVTDNEQELTGAHIQILDKEGNVVEEWDSEEGKPHEVKGLKTGEEYTLRETVAPEGYDITTDTTFSIDENGKVTSTGTIREDGVLLVEDSKMPQVSATVKKIWNDDNNRDGKRPENLTIQLLADGEKTGKSVTLTNKNGWIGRISELPKCNTEGKEIKYTWAEPETEGYKLSSNTTNGTLTTLTNTYTPETTQISVRKVWVDEGKHPNEVRVQLYADKQALGDAVTLSEGNGWKYSWDDLCKYDAGEIIQYTVTETEIPEGYAAKVTGSASTGYVITNTLQQGTLLIRKQFNIQQPEIPPEEEELKTDIQVVKIWDDNDNKDGNRPEKITVRLYAGGQEIKTAELSEKNGWRRTFGDLPKFVDGHPIHYSVKEDPVKWYVPEIRGFTITNRYQPQRTSVAIQKVWDDAGNEKFRPKSVHMKLSNGMSIELNAKNGWSGVITDLPKYVNGKEAVYTWSESEVLGYQIKSVVSEDNLTVITNEPFRNDGTPKGKKPTSRGPKTEQFDDYKTPLGVSEMINHVGDCFD